MNKDKYVFAQLIEFLDNNKFRHLIDKYDRNRYVKQFTCWNQLLAMMFGQLNKRENLRAQLLLLKRIEPSLVVIVQHDMQLKRSTYGACRFYASL